MDFHRKIEEKVFLYKQDGPKWRKDKCLVFEFEVDISTIAALLKLKLK